MVQIQLKGFGFIEKKEKDVFVHISVRDAGMNGLDISFDFRC